MINTCLLWIHEKGIESEPSNSCAVFLAEIVVYTLAMALFPDDVTSNDAMRQRCTLTMDNNANEFKINYGSMIRECWK